MTDYTTIRLKTKTKDKLDKVCKGKQTYNEIVESLVDKSKKKK